MHELPFAKSIYKSVMSAAEQNDAHHVLRVVLEVGALRDFVPDIVQKYWDYVSRGSIAEGSVVEMHSIAATASCGNCGEIYKIDTHHLHDVKCPKCGYDRGKLETGRELRIINIEID